MTQPHPKTTQANTNGSHDRLRHERILAALEEFGTAIDTGLSLDRDALLQRYADVADELVKCLDGLDLVHDVASGLEHSAEADSPAARGTKVTSADLFVLGDFRIVREIGRGGMGVVYDAQQQMLGRRVALKVLPFASMLDERQRTRFQNEARAAASLNHPHIVPVYSVGVERGVHYFAMQFIEGSSLAALLTRMRQAEDRSLGSSAPDVADDATTQANAHALLSTERSQRRGDYFRSVARLGCQIAVALQHAHERGIIHRDIKPANILLDLAGQAMIADFGLARFEGNADLTLTGDVVGTLRYAPPEQVLGKQQLVDERVDIYSLGATLYEALTLRPAFDGTDRETLLRQIQQGDAPRLRTLDRTIPIDLETIVHKAMESDPDDRYRSAQALADDLTRFLDGDPVAARPPGLAQRLIKWTRRHRAIVLTATATFLLSLLVGMLLLSGAYRAERTQREIADAARKDAELNLRMARSAVDEMYTKVATVWLSEETSPTALQLEFLQTALGLYEQMAREAEGDAEPTRNTAAAYERIGEIQAFLQDAPAAETALQSALQLYEQFIRQSPQDEESRWALIKNYRRLAEVYQSRFAIGPGRRGLRAGPCAPGHSPGRPWERRNPKHRCAICP